MFDISSVFIWWAAIFIVGLTVLPANIYLFRKFVDKGYIFTKVLGILLSSYLIWVLGSLHFLPFTKISLFLVLIFLSLINLLVFVKKNKDENLSFPWKWLIIEELIFLISIIIWSFVRGNEPSIRGLEKFMDYGFVNSILRGNYFPPLDIWLTKSPDYTGGYFINYYYYGHYINAFLTKLSSINSSITYNLMINTLYAFTFSLSFCLGVNLLHFFQSLVIKKNSSLLTLEPKPKTFNLVLAGLLTAFILTLGGNLHTLYTFTSGYPNESPAPFWQLSVGYNPDKYWYPNATRFIPNTIHEFPIYSFVVADLHGHVSDIPFVLFIIALLLNLIITTLTEKSSAKPKTTTKNFFTSLLEDYPSFSPIPLPQIALLGILIAVMYMTNAWDGLIYLILTGLTFLFIIFKTEDSNHNLWQVIYKTGSSCLFLVFFFLLANFPFMTNFRPFVSAIGVLCAPDALADKKLGPLLFEKDHCMRSSLWMLTVLWGFFYYNVLGLLVFAVKSFINNQIKKNIQSYFRISPLLIFSVFIILLILNRFQIISIVLLVNLSTLLFLGLIAMLIFKNLDIIKELHPVDTYALILVLISTLLLIFPEFFYFKDIYPAHYRANTMFKLGYQAFMMLSLVSGYTVFRLKQISTPYKPFPLVLYNTIYMLLFTLIAIYPYFAINSYYNKLSMYKGNDGLTWMKDQFPDDYAGILWLRQNVVCPEGSIDCQNQPVIAEAVGESYTDYARVSSYTGLPTIVGWPVHEWLWRGSYDEAGKRIPEVQTLYETQNLEEAKNVISKYNVKYIFVGTLEKEKYPQLNTDKFKSLGNVVFQQGNTNIYRVKS